MIGFLFDLRFVVCCYMKIKFIGKLLLINVCKVLWIVVELGLDFECEE